MSEYNDFPPGWRRISTKQFAQSHFFSYDPDRREHRQMLYFEPDGSISRDRGPMVPAILFHYYDQTGIGIVNDFWKGKVTYFAFGCDHKFEEKANLGSNKALCPMLLVCKTCGFTQGKPDSSD